MVKCQEGSKMGCASQHSVCAKNQEPRRISAVEALYHLTCFSESEDSYMPSTATINERDLVFFIRMSLTSF